MNSSSESKDGHRVEKSEPFRIQPIRKIVQLGFLLMTIWIGVEFALFVGQLKRGMIPTVSRPPGVEAFLPISALISLKYWIVTGVLNRVHPAAVVLLLLAVLTAVAFKKGFCSWICPVGLLSEYLSKLHRLLLGRTRGLPRWLDYPLRSLKYILLLFFLWSIFVMMDKTLLERFIYSPYNKVADIKMLEFFEGMSPLTSGTLIVLLALSVAIPYFWCRYLCPYGALLGSLSLLSIFKIHRNPETCIDCAKCSRACPVGVEIHSRSTVMSDECHVCLRCVDSCPVKDTLYLSMTKRAVKMPRIVYAALMVTSFVLGVSIARFSGRWDNDISAEEYLHHITRLDRPAYNHNRGQVPDYDDETGTGNSMSR